MSRFGFLVSSPRLASASNPEYAKNTTAAATNTPTMPKAVGVAPVSTCHSGAVSAVAVSAGGSGSLGGTNGTQLARCTKNSPTAITNRQTDTLTITRVLVTQADSLTPLMATAPSTSTMNTAPRLTTESSPKI